MVETAPTQANMCSSGRDPRLAIAQSLFASADGDDPRMKRSALYARRAIGDGARHDVI